MIESFFSCEVEYSGAVPLLGIKVLSTENSAPLSPIQLYISHRISTSYLKQQWTWRQIPQRLLQPPSPPPSPPSSPPPQNPNDRTSSLPPPTTYQIANNIFLQLNPRRKTNPLHLRPRQPPLQRQQPPPPKPLRSPPPSHSPRHRPSAHKPTAYHLPHHILGSRRRHDVPPALHHALTPRKTPPTT